MRFGLSVPNLGICGHTPDLLALASLAEQSGWDGFYLWDHILFRQEGAWPMVEPWTALAAIALQSQRLTLGVMITPISRRRPTVLARQVATVEELAPGRIVLGVGLGTAASADFGALGEIEDDHIRAARLDEGLLVVRGLLTEDHFSHRGEHFAIEDATFLPRPARVPIWVGGRWPNKAPFRRAARYDGVFIERAGESVTADDVVAARAYIAQHRSSDAPFDIVVGGRTAPGEAIDAGFEQAGANWYLEYLNPRAASLSELEQRVAAGPPPG